MSRDLGGAARNLLSSALPMEPLCGVSTKGFDQAQAFRHLHQTILHDPANGQHGDCLRTALAMVLGCDPLTIPNFGDDEAYPDWRGALDAWLAVRGLASVELPFPGDYSLPAVLEQLGDSCGDVPVILNGMTERGTYHSTAVYRGKLYDPHPSHAGLVGGHKAGWWWVRLICPRPFAHPQDPSSNTEER